LRFSFLFFSVSGSPSLLFFLAWPIISARGEAVLWIRWASTSSKLMNLNQKRVQQLALNIVQWENSVLRIKWAYLFSPS
jgi:hypothetical protein